MAVSPFAAQATPAPAIELGTGTWTSGLGSSLDHLNPIEKQWVSVTTMTQQSSETAVGDGEWTQWEGSNQEEYAAYDVDFQSFHGADSLPLRSESIHRFPLYHTHVLFVNEYIEPFPILMSGCHICNLLVVSYLS